jgi:hypothetical protein
MDAGLTESVHEHGVDGGGGGGAFTTIVIAQCAVALALDAVPVYVVVLPGETVTEPAATGETAPMPLSIEKAEAPAVAQEMTTAAPPLMLVALAASAHDAAAAAEEPPDEEPEEEEDELDAPLVATTPPALSCAKTCAGVAAPVANAMPAPSAMTASSVNTLATIGRFAENTCVGTCVIWQPLSQGSSGR